MSNSFGSGQQLQLHVPVLAGLCALVVVVVMVVVIVVLLRKRRKRVVRAESDVRVAPARPCFVQILGKVFVLYLCMTGRERELTSHEFVQSPKIQLSPLQQNKLRSHRRRHS